MAIRECFAHLLIWHIVIVIISIIIIMVTVIIIIIIIILTLLLIPLLALLLLSLQRFYLTSNERLETRIFVHSVANERSVAL